MQETPEVVIENLTVQDRDIFAWVTTCQVTDKDSQRNAENLLIGARAAFKRADGKRKELLEPVRETEKRITDLFKPYLTRLTFCIDKINGSLQVYHAEQLQITQDEQNYRMAEQAAKLAEAKETGEVVDLPTAEVISGPAKTSRPDMGTVTYRDDYDIKVVNPDLVPRDLCEPSMPKIRARVKSGITNIPGVLVMRTFTTVAKSG